LSEQESYEEELAEEMKLIVTWDENFQVRNYVLKNNAEVVKNYNNPIFQYPAHEGSMPHPWNPQINSTGVSILNTENVWSLVAIRSSGTAKMFLRDGLGEVYPISWGGYSHAVVCKDWADYRSRIAQVARDVEAGVMRVVKVADPLLDKLESKVSQYKRAMESQGPAFKNDVNSLEKDIEKVTKGVALLKSIREEQLSIPVQMREELKSGFKLGFLQYELMLKDLDSKIAMVKDLERML